MTEEAHSRRFAVWRAALQGIVVAGAIAGLYLLSRFNYFLFHGLTGWFGVVVLCVVFIILYGARRVLEDDFLLLIGIASLFTAIFEALHILTYAGMRVFPGQYIGLASQLWIGSRYLQSFSFLLAPAFIRRRANLPLAFVGYVTASALLLTAIFGGFFPACYVEGGGLTFFMKVNEYAIALIFLASAGLLIRHRSHFEHRVFLLLVGFLVASSGSEVILASSVYAQDVQDFVGHLFKTAAYVQLCSAVVITGLERPQDLLFRQLDREREHLRMRQGEMEGQVRRRSVEVDRVRDVLAAEALARGRAEQALAESQRRFQEILEKVQLLTVILDIQGNIIFCNDFFLRVTGWRREEIVGRNWFELFAPRDIRPEGWFPPREGVSLSTYNEDEILTRGGERRVIFWTNLILRDSQGAVNGVARIGNDVTDARQTAKALEQQLAHLSLLNRLTRSILSRSDLGSMLRAVLQRLRDGLPVDFAAVFLLHTGGEQATTLTCAELLGISFGCTGVSPGTEISVEEIGFRECLQGQTVSVADAAQVHVPFVQGLANIGLRSVVGVPLQTSEEVLGILLVARQGTDAFRSEEVRFLRQVSDHCALAIRHVRLLLELRTIYEDLRRMQEQAMLNERLRMLGQMASGIAHDINNAISPVLIFADLLLRDPELSEQARKRLRFIRTAAEDVAKTVDRLRDFYRPRSPEEVLQSVDLNEEVRQVLEMTRPRWANLPQQRGTVIELRTDLQEGLPPVMGIREEIRQALTNLVFNSVDAMPQGGTLTLRTYEVGAEGESREVICVEVSDTGVGMDEKTKQRALEPFFTTKGEDGTGMGLSVVYGVMQRHKGWIEIESALGEGTTVRLIFRKWHPEEAEHAEETGVICAPLRILCIDDEPLVRMALKEMLESVGHTVEIADGGQAGLEIFRAAQGSGEPFDVVITDLGMPYVSGEEVVTAVKQESPETPVIVLSGWGVRAVSKSRTGKGQDSSLREDHVLSKPPSLRSLQRALASVLKEGRGSERM